MKLEDKKIHANTTYMYMQNVTILFRIICLYDIISYKINGTLIIIIEENTLSYSSSVHSISKHFSKHYLFFI